MGFLRRRFYSAAASPLLAYDTKHHIRPATGCREDMGEAVYAYTYRSSRRTLEIGISR